MEEEVLYKDGVAEITRIKIETEAKSADTAYIMKIIFNGKLRNLERALYETGFKAFGHRRYIMDHETQMLGIYVGGDEDCGSLPIEVREDCRYSEITFSDTIYDICRTYANVCKKLGSRDLAHYMKHIYQSVTKDFSNKGWGKTMRPIGFGYSLFEDERTKDEDES